MNFFVLAKGNTPFDIVNKEFNEVKSLIFKSFKMETPNNRYEAPHTEIIEIEGPCVLCASGADASSDAGGGTMNMNMQGGYGW